MGKLERIHIDETSDYEKRQFYCKTHVIFSVAIYLVKYNK